MNIYTLYWDNGSKSYVAGVTIAAACAAAGYSAGTIKTISWYDLGITADHIYSRTLMKWVPFKENQTLSGYVRFDDLRGILGVRAMYFTKEYQHDFKRDGQYLKLVTDPVNPADTLVSAADAEAFIKYVWQARALTVTQ